MPWMTADIRPVFARSRTLRDFHSSMIASGGTSNHSAMGASLRLEIERLEEAMVPYTLEARPGQGYRVTVPKPEDR